MPEWFHQLGPMGWPLAACSVIALATCFERAVFSIKNRMRGNGDYRRIAGCLTENRALPKPVRDDIAGVMLNELRRPYLRGIAGLEIIGHISPMLGLTGTILGIIKSFREVASQPAPVSAQMVAGGLWEAMLTTAAGLLIALPVLVMAHLFRRLSDRRLEDFCLRLNKLSLSFETGGKDLGETAK